VYLCAGVSDAEYAAGGHVVAERQHLVGGQARQPLRSAEPLVRGVQVGERAAAAGGRCGAGGGGGLGSAKAKDHCA